MLMSGWCIKSGRRCEEGKELGQKNVQVKKNRLNLACLRTAALSLVRCTPPSPSPFFFPRLSSLVRFGIELIRMKTPLIKDHLHAPQLFYWALLLLWSPSRSILIMKSQAALMLTSAIGREG